MRMTRNSRTRVLMAAGLLILAVGAGACGKKNQPPETTAETTSAVTESTAAPTTMESTEAAASTTMSKADRKLSDQMTDTLTQINDKFTEGGSAGISLKAAAQAADLMAWYVKEKPGDLAMQKAAETFTGTVGDKDAFRKALDMIYESALSTTTAEGKSLLGDAGWKGEVTWTKEDVNTLFDALFEGSGQKK